MVGHLINLLVSSFVNLPNVLAGNWFSLLLPLGLYILTEGASLRAGWTAMKGKVLRNTKILILVYGTIFAWSVTSTVYADHESQKMRLDNVRKQQASERSVEAGKLSAANDKYQSLRVECARTDGTNETLANQNRDQQNTINACQHDALRLLEPSPLSIDAVTIPTAMGVNGNELQFLLLTNKVISPVSVTAICSQDVDSVAIGPVADQSLVIGRKEMYNSHRSFKVTFDSPAWTPKAPLIASFRFAKTVGTCKFSE